MEDAEDADMPSVPAEITEKDFLQWVDIENNVEIPTKETIEEREQEIVARYTGQSEIVESEDEEEHEEPDPATIGECRHEKNARSTPQRLRNEGFCFNGRGRYFLKINS